MLSFTEENYLKALFILGQSKNGVSVNELSHHLDIRKPTVNSMIKKLSDKGLVNYQVYKPIELTDKGLTIAKLIVRRHRLTEMFLVNKMGFSWDEVHSIAEQIEHIKSEVFFDKMDEMLGFPIADPHGSPIPNSKGILPTIKNRSLTNCEIGDKVIFNAVKNSSPDFLKYLTNKNLLIGQIIEIVNKESFDGSIEVIVKNKSINLSKLICENILVADQ